MFQASVHDMNLSNNSSNTTCFGFLIVNNNLSDNITDTFGINLAYSAINAVAVLFVSAVLAVDVYYIRNHRTTFILRLFFYLSVVALISIVSNYAGVLCEWTSELVESSSNSIILCPLIILAVVVYESSRVMEVVIIICVNLSFLKKLYKYAYRPSISLQSKAHSHRRCKEVIFLHCLVLFGFTVSAIVIVIEPIIDQHRAVYSHFILLTTIQIILSLLGFALLIYWAYKLKKTGLLKKKSKEVHEILTFYIAVLFLVVVGGFSFVILLVLQSTSSINLVIIEILNPIADVCLCLPLLFHVCMNVFRTKRRKKTIEHPTNPPSTRVSLPSNTVDNALKFLSPSTDSPTDYTTTVSSSPGV